jgi:hypothetical protein
MVMMYAEDARGAAAGRTDDLECRCRWRRPTRAAAATFAMPPRRKHRGKGGFRRKKIGEDFVTLEQYKHGLVGFSKKKTRVDWK